MLSTIAHVIHTFVLFFLKKELKNDKNRARFSLRDQKIGSDCILWSQKMKRIADFYNIILHLDQDATCCIQMSLDKKRLFFMKHSFHASSDQEDTI